MRQIEASGKDPSGTGKTEIRLIEPKVKNKFNMVLRDSRWMDQGVSDLNKLPESSRSVFSVAKTTWLHAVLAFS